MADTTRIVGGVRTDALAQVSADQVTILGNGTHEDPLRLGSGAGGVTFVADGLSRGEPPVKVSVGQVVRVEDAAPTVGTAFVAAASAAATGDPTSAAAQACGVVVLDGAGAAVTVQFGGVSTLTTAQWDAVTGGTGGLAPGATYYVSDVTPGALVETPPAGAGTFVVQVGDALSTTALLLSTPAFPLLVPP